MDCSLILDNFEKIIRLARGGVREKPHGDRPVQAVQNVQSLRYVQIVKHQRRFQMFQGSNRSKLWRRMQPFLSGNCANKHAPAMPGELNEITQSNRPFYPRFRYILAAAIARGL
jgi:hypothetical protein